MLIMPPGHARAVRERRRLRPAEKWLIWGGLGAVAALVVAVVIAVFAGTGTTGHGCVTVGLAYSTGGDQVTHCGDAAKALCAGVGHPGGITGASARSVAAACRKAGLPVG